MPLPRSIARFNKRFTSRWAEPLARRFSNFAVVHHRGRRTGRSYATPVNCFGDNETVVVALTYGVGADWAQNVLRGPATLELRGRVRRIVAAELAGRDETWATLPRLVRVALRVLRVRDFLRLSLWAPIPS
jgi:deazaflavin-dependent oxidoreductase (nitroreductase family)